MVESKELVYPEIKSLFEGWEKNADKIIPYLRPPLNQDLFPIPKLLGLYHDVYSNILIGRYSASIVLMGVLLEAVVKERIRITTGKDYREPFGPCIKKLRKEELMRIDEIHFLTAFKNKIRNPYQHIDDYEILKDKYFPIWPIRFKDEISIEKLENCLTKIKRGEIEPKYLHAADIPAIRGMARGMHDKQIAIHLFNEVHDFLIGVLIKYFKKEVYDEYHKNYDSGLESDVYHEI